MNTKQNAITLCLAGFLAVSFIPAVQAQTDASAVSQTSKTMPGSKQKGPKAVNNAVCPVSNEPIGSMGEGIKVTYKDSVVTLCCKSCVEAFNANPEEYLKKAKAGKKLPTAAKNKKTSDKKTTTTKSAAAAQDVKNAHCPVSGKAIGSMGDGVAVFHNGYQVTLCCAGCKGRFEANPDQYLKTAMSDTKRP